MLLVRHTPMCVCIQDTHLKPAENFSIRGYDGYVIEHSKRRSVALLLIGIVEDLSLIHI